MHTPQNLGGAWGARQIRFLFHTIIQNGLMAGVNSSSQTGGEGGGDGGSSKPVCRYGETCYRKSPQHFAEFDHPWQSTMVELFCSLEHHLALLQTERSHLHQSDQSSTIQAAAAAVTVVVVVTRHLPSPHSRCSISLVSGGWMLDSMLHTWQWASEVGVVLCQSYIHVYTYTLQH